MNGAAAEDRFNRVVYVDLPLPPDFHVRTRRRVVDPAPPPRRRGTSPASYRCQKCEVEFVPKGFAARVKRVGGKSYPRRYCSRECYRQSIIGRPKRARRHGGRT